MESPLGRARRPAYTHTSPALTRRCAHQSKHIIPGSINTGEGNPPISGLITTGCGTGAVPRVLAVNFDRLVARNRGNSL